MIDRLRTLSARIITHHNVAPRELRIRAWAWLAAETNDSAEKKRCLQAILELDPGVEWLRAGSRLKKVIMDITNTRRST